MRTFATQALADLADHYQQLRRRVLPLLAELIRHGHARNAQPRPQAVRRLQRPDL